MKRLIIMIKKNPKTWGWIAYAMGVTGGFLVGYGVCHQFHL